ncbi:hypothetical protein V8G54_018432, partial [Vigna mungo]
MAAGLLRFPVFKLEYLSLSSRTLRKWELEMVGSHESKRQSSTEASHREVVPLDLDEAAMLRSPYSQITITHITKGDHARFFISLLVPSKIYSLTDIFSQNSHS